MPPRPTVKKVALLYLADGPPSRKSERSHFTKRILPLLRDLPLASIDSAVVNSLRDKLLAEGASLAIVRRTCFVLMRLYEYGVANGLCPFPTERGRDVFEAVSLPERKITLVWE